MIDVGFVGKPEAVWQLLKQSLPWYLHSAHSLDEHAFEASQQLGFLIKLMLLASSSIKLMSGGAWAQTEGIMFLLVVYPPLVVTIEIILKGIC